jgi:chemotaxis protein methyltransferase CheR
MVDVPEIELKLLLEAIFQRFRYDFRSYAPASLQRRVARALIEFDCQTISGLQERVLHDPHAFPKLLRFLTIQVSDMFRDPPFFRVLRERVAPFLSTYPSLKIWIAGCSTGEEVYSMAILLKEEGLLDRAMIYATDINGEALRRAESGVYPLDRIPSFTKNHRLSGGNGSLSKYYTAAYGSAVFDRSLLKRVVFSDHSLATDNVFAEVQLISCRNVLIYFDRTLQERAVGLFKDALCRRGFLGLGAKESLYPSPHGACFSDFAPGERWYQRC